MRDLRARGVTFLTFDSEGSSEDDVTTRADGTRSAWFEDSEGNLLALVEFATSAA